MYYGKLNGLGSQIADRLARDAGLSGKVATELAPNGERYAFFKLTKPAHGREEVSLACDRLRAAGFDPDVLLDFGAGPVVKGGFIGKAFSDKASEIHGKAGAAA